MKMMYPEKQKNAVASGKSAFHISKCQTIRRFQVKNGANCETPFPVFFFFFDIFVKSGHFVSNKVYFRG